ncbi:hypothetical protein P4S72_07335 [Vibrio sp. PP-XX7]
MRLCLNSNQASLLWIARQRSPAFVTLYVLVRPMLAKLAGWTEWQLSPARLITKAAFKKSPGENHDYQRSGTRLKTDNSMLTAQVIRKARRVPGR